MIYLRQKTEPATEKRPTGKTLHHGNNSIYSESIYPQSVSTPPPPETI